MNAMRWLGAVLLLAVRLGGQDDAGFAPLFDGKTLDGWVRVGDGSDRYFVRDGILVCPREAMGSRLMTVKDYANFILRFEFRMEPDANNGIAIRTPERAHPATQGMEIQIIDTDGPKYGQGRSWLRPEQQMASVYKLIPARQGFLKESGEWNRQEILLNGRHIRITLNGAIVLDSSLDIVRENEVLKKHPGVLRTTGRIGIIAHKSLVEFRNVRVKDLPTLLIQSQ